MSITAGPTVGRRPRRVLPDFTKEFKQISDDST